MFNPFSTIQISSDRRERFEMACRGLFHLFGARYIRKILPTEHLIAKLLKNVGFYDQLKLFDKRDYSLSQLEVFVSDLLKIEKYNVAMLRKFKKSLISAEENNFYGIRFEVKIASIFIDKKINFKKSESPDFTISDPQENLFFECGSVHLSKDKAEDLKYKLSSCIREKSDLPYANSQTALFISASNIYYHSEKNKTPLSAEELFDFLKPIVNNCNFGSVFIFISYALSTTKEYTIGFWRFDNEKIKKEFKEFLELYFPHGI